MISFAVARGLCDDNPVRGVKKPPDCKIFGTVCTPENPIGSCMVSPEGSCAAYYAYGRFRDLPKSA